MAIENWINISGSYKKISDQYINISGTFKKVTEKWINISGVWKQVYNAVTGSFPADWASLFNKTQNTYYFSSGAKTVSVIGSGAVDVSIIGGTMQKNGVGGYGATALQFSNGDTIDFKLQAASSPTTPTTVTATIAQGGDTLSWTIWTT